MAKQDEQLTHEQMWDDSYLQDSWNEAVSEYEKYHSLASKGLDGEVLLAELRASGLELTEDEVEKRINGLFRDSTDHKHQVRGRGEDDSGFCEANGTSIQGRPAGVDGGEQQGIGAVKLGEVDGEQQRNQQRERTAAPAMPDVAQQLSAQVKDEGVKKLVMSWYYAGYYTGLYEGQQQQQQL